MREKVYTRVSFSFLIFCLFVISDIFCSLTKYSVPREHIFSSATSNITTWVRMYHLQYLTSEYVFKCPSINDYRIICDHDWSEIHSDLLHCRHANANYYRKIKVISFCVIGLETFVIVSGLVYVCYLRITLKRTYEAKSMRMSSIENNPEVTWKYVDVLYSLYLIIFQVK